MKTTTSFARRRRENQRMITGLSLTCASGSVFATVSDIHPLKYLRFVKHCEKLCSFFSFFFVFKSILKLFFQQKVSLFIFKNISQSSKSCEPTMNSLGKLVSVSSSPDCKSYDALQIMGSHLCLSLCLFTELLRKYVVAV